MHKYMVNIRIYVTFTYVMWIKESLMYKMMFKSELMEGEDIIACQNCP